jgi:hypothetical protein
VAIFKALPEPLANLNRPYEVVSSGKHLSLLYQDASVRGLGHGAPVAAAMEGQILMPWSQCFYVFLFLCRVRTICCLSDILVT